MNSKKPGRTYNPMSSSQRIAVTHGFQFRFEQSLFSIECIIVNIVLPGILNFDIDLHNLPNILRTV